jgi:hypothetical protein
MLVSGTPRPAVANADQHVAIVCFLSGTGFVRVAGKRTGLELFQRLRPGSAVEVARDSTMVLALFTGDRFEFGAQSAATVARTGLDRRKGPIRELPPVPAMIEIAPLASEGNPGARMAGTRIRGTGRQSIGNLYPAGGDAVRLESAAVRFDPVPGYERYRVVVENDRGNVVFSTETAATAVPIPAAALAAASTYYWSVRTLDTSRPVVQADALFRTLSDDDATRRAAFKKHVDAAGDVVSHALLAEFDRWLGLRQEACEGLRRAFDADPAANRMNDALAHFGCPRN